MDDDPSIREVLGAYLRQEGHQVLEATSGPEALARASEAGVLILDLMLPGLSGWEVAGEVRRAHPDLPLLMLTARGEEAERVRGLDLGADDYVVKPFSPREVVSRVRALLRRSGLRDEMAFGGLVLRPKARSAELDGETLGLSKLEFDLLLTLAQHPGLVWSRERLLERVWGADFPGVNRVVDVHVAALRKKLGEDGERQGFIETVRGVGYRFKEG